MKVINSILFILIVLFSCKPSTSGEVKMAEDHKISTSNASSSESSMQVFIGETMGTTYSIKYSGKLIGTLKDQVDRLLIDINNSVSTYIDKSAISKFNKSKDYFNVENFTNEQQQYFLDNYTMSVNIYDMSDGHFDPTVMPVVNYWGFGYDGKKKITKIDSAAVAKLMPSIGMDKIRFDPDSKSWLKSVKSVELDFSAIAKGYAVDMIAELFDGYGLKNYYIEIGGECRAKGDKMGTPWIIGVSLPDPKAGVTDIVTKIDLVNMSVATSGNYRNFYELGDDVISHTIDPKSGFPERNNLLSATIFHSSCARADALATACMAMGFDEGFPFIDGIPGAECYMVYMSRNGQVVEAASAGISKYLQ